MWGHGNGGDLDRAILPNKDNEVLTMSVNVQSVVSSVAKSVNGKGKVKAEAKRTTTLANPANAPLTEQGALDIAFEYGASIAGQDGFLTKALRQFNTKAFTKRIIEHIAAAYYVKKFDYSKDKALATAGLMKHNPEKQSDEYRTEGEERIMVSVRMLVSRAKKLAGIVDPDTVARQEKANTSRAEAKAERDALEARRNEAWEIVHPNLEEVDVNAAMKRMFATMRNFMNEHSGKFVGDAGTAWRDWIAKAPKIAKA